MTQLIKRVVVSLDAASETGTAIDTAARLAAHWHVPLCGVFVEDEELVCLAGLPFACQFTVTAGREPLTEDHIEDHFRAFAGRARRELDVAARRHGADSSFEVVRGPLAADAFGRADQDLIVAGAASRPIGGYFRVASHWWSSIAIIARPFLLAQREWETGGSILAILGSHGPVSVRTLDIAAQIANFCSATLTVAGPPDLGSDDFENWVSQHLEGRRLTFQTELARTVAAGLRHRIIELDCRLLVVEAGTAGTWQDALREHLPHLSCDLLVVS